MLMLKLQYFGHLMRRTDHWKRPWCWERLKAEGEGDDRWRDDWMASPTQWTWVWASSGSWWWTGRPDVLQPMGPQNQTQLSDSTTTTIYVCVCVCVCVYLNHFGVHQKLTPHHKSTVLQLKKKEGKNILKQMKMETLMGYSKNNTKKEV